jgi:hypothetical protein
MLKQRPNIDSDMAAIQALIQQRRKEAFLRQGAPNPCEYCGRDACRFWTAPLSSGAIIGFGCSDFIQTGKIPILCPTDDGTCVANSALKNSLSVGER